MTASVSNGRLARAPVRIELALGCLVAALVLSACGGGESDPRQVDRKAIESVVERINAAVAERDAAAWCAVYSPDSISETFGSPARCRTETGRVLAGSGQERRLRLVGVAFDGPDRARVRFQGAAGEANFSKVDGDWYLDLLQEVEADPGAPAGEMEGGQ